MNTSQFPIWVKLDLETRRRLNDKFNKDLLITHNPEADPDERYNYVLDNRVLCFKPLSNQGVRKRFFQVVAKTQNILEAEYPGKDFVISYEEKNNIGSIYFIWDATKTIKDADIFKSTRTMIIKRVNKDLKIIPEDDTFYPPDKLPN